MIRVAVHGAAGRMGRQVVQAIAAQNDMSLAAAIEHAESPHAGADASALAGLPPSGVVVSASLQALDAAEVVIDFAGAAGTVALLQACIERALPAVIGSTGWGDEAWALLGRLSHHAPVLVAANMSPGVAVLTHLAEQAARLLGEGYDVEIVEMHHRAKLDAPSGTALQLARSVAQAKGLNLQQAARYGRQGQVGARSNDEIGMLSLRGGDVVGDHSVVFAGPSERIELVHRAHDRALFAHGAVRAARWLQGQAAGFYSMADVMGLTHP